MIHAFRYTEELEKVGFSTEQAKTSVQIWMDLMDQNFATKADFKEHYFMSRTDLLKLEKQFSEMDTKFEKQFSEMDAKFEKKFSDMDAKFEKKFSDMDAKFEKRFSDMDTKFEKRFSDMDAKFEKKFIEIDSKFEKLESRLIIKLGIMMAASIGIISTIISFQK